MESVFYLQSKGTTLPLMLVHFCSFMFCFLVCCLRSSEHFVTFVDEQIIKSIYKILIIILIM